MLVYHPIDPILGLSCRLPASRSYRTASRIYQQLTVKYQHSSQMEEMPGKHKHEDIVGKSYVFLL
jgi:hypothetical protein